MTEGSEHSQDTAEQLQIELEELLRQHEQYTLALDAAMDPRTSLRLQRTLERLDEEIEGLREALGAYQEDAEAPQGQAILPEWDEDEEEPATSIYNTGDNENPFMQVRDLLAAPPPGEEGGPPTVMLGPKWEGVAAAVHAAEGGGGPAEGAGAPGQPQPSTGTEPSPTVRPSTGTEPVLPAVQSEDPEEQATREQYQRPPAPPGGASFNSLPPPVSFRDAPWGHTEIVPPLYDGETQPTPKEAAELETRAITPPVSPAASSFASPPNDGAASPFGGPSVSHGGSPFGGPAPGPGPGFGATGNYGVVEDKDEWSMGSRILLALLVLLFLGGVGWILSQGP